MPRTEATDLQAGGPPLERSIAPEEVQVYRLRVEQVPLRLTLEQRGVDVTLAVEAPSGPTMGTDAGECRWGPEVLLLAEAGEHRVEVRAKAQTGWPGSYAIRLEPPGQLPSEPLRAAWERMQQAGEAVFAGSLDAKRRGAALYREALPLWRSLRDRFWEAESLTRLASLETVTDGYPKAAEDFEQAAALWQALGQREREAAARNELGLARNFARSYDAARLALKAAIVLWDELGLRLDGAETRSNLCLVEQTVGDLNAALACSQEALTAFRNAEDPFDEARLLNNLGGIYELLGQPDAAAQSYEQALALRRKVGDLAGQAQTLNNMAVLQRALGDVQEAVRLYGEARKVLPPDKNPALQASLLNNVGFLYTYLGDAERGLPFLEDTLRLQRERKDRRGEVAALNNLGLARRQLGELAAARELHSQALGIAVELKDARQEAVSRLRLAETELAAGNAAAVPQILAPALAYIRGSGLRQAELRAALIEGQALGRSGSSPEAIALLREALAGRRAMHDRSGEAEALVALARVERAAGSEEAARGHAAEAVALVEDLRGRVASPDLRATFLATQRRAYSLLIDLLMARHKAEPQAGWDRQAFAVSERARARSLLDALGSAQGGRREGTAPAALLEKRRALQRSLSALAAKQQREQLEPVSNSRWVEPLGREIDGVLVELDSLDAEIRRVAPQSAGSSQPPPLSVEEAGALLEPGTMLLEVALGEERSYLWLLDGRTLHSFELPPQREIEDLARQTYAELSTVEAGGAGHPSAARLSQSLFGAVWSVAGKARRWVVVPDGTLHSISFAALPVPDGSGRLLLEQVEIDDLPSATTLAELRRRPRPPAPPLRAAIFADPVFSPNDPRLDPTHRPARTAAATPAGPMRGARSLATDARSFERLAASGEEADAITALVPAGEVRIARGFAANREAVLAGALRGAKVVHFATHAVADTRTPELSGLVLSQVDEAGRLREGFLGLAEIYDLQLDADLVVLSGCGTAFGKEVRGEGLMGLTRAFLYAGVPRVVASLWPVQDRAAAELMSRFYRALWKEGLSPAAALRQAQIGLRRDPRNRRYRDPFYWAGYILQGDWR